LDRPSLDEMRHDGSSHLKWSRLWLQVHDTKRHDRIVLLLSSITRPSWINTDEVYHVIRSKLVYTFVHVLRAIGAISHARQVELAYEYPKASPFHQVFDLITGLGKCQVVRNLPTCKRMDAQPSTRSKYCSTWKRPQSWNRKKTH